MSDSVDVVMPSVATEQEAPVPQSARKRPRIALDVLESRKGGRSIFGQAFGNLKQAKVENVSEAAKKRKEIDERIMGRITQEQSVHRMQDEAKRDRIAASRKEEDLAIKDGFMRLRHEVIPHLANFLLTSDFIPPHDEKAVVISRSPSPVVTVPNERPAHPPSTRNPPPLYYLPAKLTREQQKFLDRQRSKTTRAIDEERKEWLTDRKTGAEEVTALRKKAEEAIDADIKPASARERSESTSAFPVDKMDVEDKVGEPLSMMVEGDQPSTATATDGDDVIEY